MLFKKILFFIFIVVLTSTINAKDQTKIGFGFDRDFGLVGSLNSLNLFVGNRGVAIDKIVNKDSLDIDADIEIEGPVYWYIGVGGFLDWENGLGARLPIGIEWYFADNMDAYIQVIPNFKIVDKTKFGLGGGLVIRYKF